MDTSIATKVGLAVALVVGLTGGGAVYVLGADLQYDPPVVESVQSEFGAVETDAAQIQTNVVVQNPNEHGLPGGATIAYRVDLNDVEMATGTKRGVRIGPGETVVELSTGFNNSRIPAWWVTHVNNGERSTLSITPSVTALGVVHRDLPAQTQSIETDLLGPLSSGEPRGVVVGDSTLLRVEDQRAHWGEATIERTPVVVETTMENTHDRPVTLDGTAYEIRMNDVVVGEGTTPSGIELAPGERGTLTVEAAIDTPKMQAWWVSHLRGGETTALNISVYGVVDEDGERTRVPLALYERRARFETDMLGSGETAVEVLEPAEASSFAPPTVDGVESEWGTVGDDTTEIVTDITLTTPADEAFADLVTLDLSQETTINGVRVAASESTVDGVPSGRGSVPVSAEMAHSTVPEWWARHLNNGERSTVVTETEGRADLGVTSVAIAVPARTSTVETGIAESFDNDTVQRVETEDGRPLLEIERTRGSWGTATAEEAPLDVAVTIENQQAEYLEIRNITYVVTLNDVVLANRTAPERYRLTSLETATIEPTMTLDNRKMAEWWPTHVRNGERSAVHTEVWVTVESTSLRTGTTVRRVKVDALDGTTTIETSMLD